MLDKFGLVVVIRCRVQGKSLKDRIDEQYKKGKNVSRETSDAALNVTELQFEKSPRVRAFNVMLVSLKTNCV
ncbi:hypothetical protein PSSHI_42680 [Photobacterium sp. R1]